MTAIKLYRIARALYLKHIPVLPKVASGADAYLLHVTTTPSVAYIARMDEFDCGIMISASHNPYYDNGIKLINRHGEKMDEETINLVQITASVLSCMT